MYIVKNSSWNKNSTLLEKFAIERIIQRCGFTENITNKHRTSNGYTLIKDLIQYCNLTYKRSRTVKTLITTLEESKSPFVRQNIYSDIIIDRYFKDLKKFILKFDHQTLLANKSQPDLIVLQNFEHRLKVFSKQLDDNYFGSLKIEFEKIDYQEKNDIARNAERLSALIDILVPFLIFKGYSQATISEILISWLKRGYHITVRKFLSFLHFKSRPFTFLQYIGDELPESLDFIKIMSEELKIEIVKVQGENITDEFINRYSIPATGIYALYSLNAIDPHKHVRDNFDYLLKKLVVNKERQSLAVFNNFFDHSFWNNHSNQPLLKFKKIKLDGDPISVKTRGRTLRNTLFISTKQFNFNFSDEDNIPSLDDEALSNSVYYYNLALGSKSIENSLSLLWTSLESIQPYKIYSSDIEAVQDFVSKSLSIGSLARDLHSFALRIKEANRQCNYTLKLNYPNLDHKITSDKLVEWYYWLINHPNEQKLFNKLKSRSELLAFQAFKLVKPLRESNQEVLFNRFERSSQSIKYQLQRIYSHRNKIVHSGDMVNEYTNLWSHLEWYVGKLLAYLIIQKQFKQNSKSPADDIFMQIHADRDYLISYLEKNISKPCSQLPERIVKLLFAHSWQAY